MRVLVVEDDRDLRDAVIEILRMEGFEAVPAGDGCQALACLHRDERPCLILLDLMLPEMDGERCCNEIARDPELRKIPIVIFSARADTARVARRLAVPYLEKPFEVSALLEAVKRHASPPHASRAHSSG